jgi:hypothetical protein
MRILGGLSLLSLLLVVAIISIGQLKESEALLGPSGDQSLKQLVQTPIGRARSIDAEQDFNTLYTDARSNYVGLSGHAISSITSAGLAAGLRQDEPEYSINAPGGVYVAVVGSDFTFCTSVYSGWECAATNETAGMLGGVSTGGTRALAQAAAIASLTQGSGSSASASGLANSGANDEGANAVLQKARTLSGTTKPSS